MLYLRWKVIKILFYSDALVITHAYNVLTSGNMKADCFIFHNIHFMLFNRYYFIYLQIVLLCAIIIESVCCHGTIISLVEFERTNIKGLISENWERRVEIELSTTILPSVGSFGGSPRS